MTLHRTELTEINILRRFSRVGSCGISFCTTLLKAYKKKIIHHQTLSVCGVVWCGVCVCGVVWCGVVCVWCVCGVVCVCVWCVCVCPHAYLKY